jgi:hypothetical protein
MNGEDINRSTTPWLTGLEACDPREERYVCRKEKGKINE